MKIINVAVIGLGYWGPNLLRNFMHVPGVQVIFGCDLYEKNLVQIKKQYPHIIITKNYQDILSDSDVDVVAIATPLKTHFAIAKASLEAGKHVVIEKPMTQTSLQAKELIRIAKKKNKIIFVEHTFVYSEPVKKIKQLIDAKKIGKVYYFDSTRINLGMMQFDTDVVWDLAPHDFSILNFLLKEKPLTIQAFGSSYISKDRIEVAHIFVRYEKDIYAHIHVSWLSPVKIRTILLGGSRKMVVYNDIEPSEKIRIYDKGITLPVESVTPFTPAYRSGNIIIPKIKQLEALLTEVTHVVACIRKNVKPLTGAEEGLVVIEMLEAAEKSLQTNSPVYLHEK